jgi:hypothetical protein
VHTEDKEKLRIIQIKCSLVKTERRVPLEGQTGRHWGKRRLPGQGKMKGLRNQGQHQAKTTESTHCVPMKIVRHFEGKE